MYRSLKASSSGETNWRTDFIRLSVIRNELVHGSTWQLEQSGFESLSFTIVGRQQTTKPNFLLAESITR
jgi:hypothetical protein